MLLGRKSLDMGKSLLNFYVSVQFFLQLFLLFSMIIITFVCEISLPLHISHFYHTTAKPLLFRQMKHFSSYLKQTRFLFLMLCLCHLMPANAQMEGFTRTIIHTIPQLPVNALNCSFHDSEGYMWYGTVDGLCRDDGYTVHTFRNDFLTPELIQINLVLGITEDKRHRIWFCTHKGMYILDKTNYSIKAVDIPELNEAHIDNIISASDGFIYALCERSLFKVGLDGKLADRYDFPGKVFSAYEDSHHRLYACITPKGLYVRPKGSRKFQPIDTEINAMAVCEDNSRKFLWLTCHDRRMFKLVFGPKPALIPQTISGHTGSGNVAFMEFVQDNARQYLWIRTSGGLRILRPEAGNHLSVISTDGWMPQVNMLLTRVNKDRNGNVWVSGFDAKSFYAHYQHNAVTGHVCNNMQTLTNYSPAVVTLCRDEGGYVWYYQEGNGLFFTNPSTGKIVSFRNCPSTATAPLGVVPYLIRSNKANCIWASTLKGAYLVQRKGETMKMQVAIDMSAHVRKTGNMECVYEDNRDNLWMSTMNGLYVWKPATQRVKVLSENIGDISDFVQTSDGMVWATIRNRGLCRIDANDKIKLYPHNIDFTSLDATSNGHLWLGTGEGRVLEFVPAESDSLKDWSLRCGMNGDMVDHIAVDYLNHVWITTNQRIREFNPRNGAFRMLKTNDENIPLDRFLPRAVYFDIPTGTMYFGGIPGYITVKPSKALESIPKNIQVKITDVTVGGKSIWLDPERRNAANSIDIRPDETDISIQFSTLDYVNRKQINYAYRLSGIDKDWIYLTEEHNAANYNKLPKGKYTLEVKATDENGLWSETVTQFTIHRLPAWYETWYAYTLYIIAIVSLVAIFARIYLNWHKERQERELIENLLKAKQMQIETERREMQDESNAITATEEGNKAVEPEITPQRSFDEEFLAKATRIVEQNLANPELNVVFLASELGMSRSTFMRKIKAVTGQTPLDYIKSVKLRHAYAMLQDKTATIQDVMKAIGYSDRKTFTQSFKETFNITPSEHQHGND